MGSALSGDSMKVTSFEILTIDAKRFAQSGEKAQNVRVDQNSSITEITKTGVDSANILFRLLINYANRGYIKIEGSVLVGEGIDPLIDEWSKTATMPVEEANIVHNVIVSNCLPTALLVSRDVKLPPPFPLPRIDIQKKGGKPHIGGIEVA